MATSLWTGVTALVVIFAIVAAWRSSPFLIKATQTSGSAAAPAVEPSLTMKTEAKYWNRHFNFDLVAKHAASKNGEYVWGSLRPYIYFGMKTQSIPFSLATGLMWSGARGVHAGLRHETAQGQLAKFEWLEHDGKNYGLEHLLDRDNLLDIKASFAIPSTQDMDEEGPAPVWSQRIIATPLSSSAEQSEGPREQTNIVVYLGLEGSDMSQEGVAQMLLDAELHLEVLTTPREQVLGNVAELTVLGVSKVFGSFSLSVTARLTGGGDQACLETMADDPVSTCGTSTVSLGYSALAAADTTKGVERLERELQQRALQASLGQQPQHPAIVSETGAAFVAVKATVQSAATTNVLPSMVLELVMHRHGSSSIQEMARWANGAAESRTANVDRWMRSGSEAFHAKFDSALGLSSLSSSNMPNASFGVADVSAAKAALSSLLGGIGYFYGTPRLGDAIDGAKKNGDSKTAVSTAMEHPGSSKHAPPDPIALLSATPSRTAFPRGFLWDEGFHQLLVSHWDAKLSTAVLSHWLDAMYRCSISDSGDNTGGWIPREMILGDTATRRVPDEFVTQRVDIANPPTLLLAVDVLLTRFVEGGENKGSDSERIAVIAFLTDALPALHQWLQWFLSSQRGIGNAFRWRGRSTSDNKVLPNTLASGLDDYPRSPLPHEAERHLDLHCWMVMACRTLERLQLMVRQSGIAAEALSPSSGSGSNVDQELQVMRAAALDFDYSAKAASLLAAMDELHWSEQMQAYTDVGLAGSQDALRSEVLFRCGNPSDPRSVVDVSVPVEVVKSGQQFCPESHPKPMFPHGDGHGGVHVRERYVVAGDVSLQYIPRLGYVNLFPLLLRLVDPHSAKLKALLALVEGPNLLWSEHGLRSLATTDAFYRRNNAPGDAPYWRGPIWININFLALGALQHYSKVPGPEQAHCAQLYKSLRENVLRTVLGEYHRTGFLWEQFDDKEGVGIRGHPFSGWTALVVNIMAERYY